MRPKETSRVVTATVPDGHASQVALEGAATAFDDVDVSTLDVLPEPGMIVMEIGAAIEKQSNTTGVAPTVPER